MAPRVQLEAWASAAEDVFARRVSLVRAAPEYARRGLAFAMEKVASSLAATVRSGDRVLHEAYVLWVTKVFGCRDAEIYAALTAYQRAHQWVPASVAPTEPAAEGDED